MALKKPPKKIAKHDPAPRCSELLLAVAMERQALDLKIRDRLKAWPYTPRGRALLATNTSSA